MAKSISAAISNAMQCASRRHIEIINARLKAELKRKGVTYAQLVDKLAEIGVDEKEVNIRNKLARGKFSAAFLIQCLEAIDVSTVSVS